MMGHTIQRALVSVYDKTGVVDFCRDLVAAGTEILSSGGTARLLREEDVPVTEVSDYTGFPEMMDGRLKTLHPRIHGGILALRDKPEHRDAMESHGILPIDLVVVNLYPFEKTAAEKGAPVERVIEMIDIGGPTMVRAAAKNHAHVGVVVSPADYTSVLGEILETGGLSDDTRRRLAATAFAHTSVYDGAVHDYLVGLRGEAGYPETAAIGLIKVQDMRYGENPHQTAAFYRDPRSSGPSIARAEQFQGKALSFNNILDFDAALNLAASFDRSACAIIKHGNPCGVALGTTPEAAFRSALRCDPVSAFGGVIAFNRPVDEAAAAAVREAFYEGVVAPEFSDDALATLKKKKNLRLLGVGDLSGFRRDGYDLRRVAGGLLVQQWDDLVDPVRECRVATEREPTDEEWAALEFAWIVAKYVKSNAIVYTDAERTLGIGAGQMSRVDSARFAIQKAQSSLQGAVMASDAFFPFRDGLDVAAEAGIRAVVQPGGSKRDEEVVAAANEHGIAMVFTGHRHFRH
jgi:phosphoribosylaminoimidazolecarboxamide formyltransferase/IMP cyclohydrolase